MDNIIEIHFDYLFYSKQRVTPIFISTDELLSFTYGEFYSRMLQEVPHIAKSVLLAESLQMILVQESRPEIDLSHKYFMSQITRLLNKGLQTIVIRVVANATPAVQSSGVGHLGEPKTKRCLDVSQKVANDPQNPGQGSLNFTSNTIINNSISPKFVSKSVMLPLE